MAKWAASRARLAMAAADGDESSDAAHDARDVAIAEQQGWWIARGVVQSRALKASGRDDERTSDQQILCDSPACRLHIAKTCPDDIASEGEETHCENYKALGVTARTDGAYHGATSPGQLLPSSRIPELQAGSESHVNELPADVHVVRLRQQLQAQVEARPELAFEVECLGRMFCEPEK